MKLLERLLGKPGKGSLDPGDFKDPSPVRSAVVRQAAAVLLSYPDEVLLERIEPVRAALAGSVRTRPGRSRCSPG